LQPISNAMRRFDVCANNYQLFAHFRAATILLSTIMQKYLLLLVCLIATMNARAGITVVPPEETESDYYLLTLSGTVTASDWIKLSDHVKKAKSLKFETKDGYKMTTDDIHILMGNNNPSIFANTLQRLDMSDAELNDYNDLYCMSNATSDKGLHELTYFVFPKETTVIPAGMFIENKKIHEIAMLESDETGLSKFTLIGANAFKDCSNLVYVRIPEGVEEIGPSAFGGEKNGFTYSGSAFESIHLPNTLKKIGNAAFANCPNLKSVTIPYNVEYIESSAFQQNKSMTDVYVIGNNVKIKNGAFNENETFNFEYQEDGSVDFSDWKSDVTDGTNTPHPLCLHIPDNDIARNNYINPYLRALNEMPDEYLNDFNKYKDDIKAFLSNYPEIDPNGGIWYFQPNGTVPWIEMDGYKYFRKGNGKFGAESGGLYGATGDYAGWRNFMLVADDLNKKIWPDIRMVESRWYSAVFPFNLTFDQVESAYGAKTDVREFTDVYEHIVNGKLTRTVRFNTRIDKNRTDYIQKGVPYMIHPGTKVEIITVEENGVPKQIGRTIAGVDVETAEAIVNANTDLKVVKRPLVYEDDSKQDESDKYFFKGTYLRQNMPENSFYLGYEKDVWPLAFYVRTAVGVNKWSAFTSIVQKTDGSAIANAKPMDLDFTLIIPEEENFGITTNIESVSEQKSVNNGVVYNLNGQVVGTQSTNNLSKGIYIVNGKKMVVR